MKILTIFLLMASMSICAVSNAKDAQENNALPAINPNSAIYEVPVKVGVSYDDLVDSLKSVAAGMNLVSAAHFPIDEQLKKRGLDSQGVKEVRAFCNLSLGAEIMFDHPEFIVFAPCRIAIYEKPDAQNKMHLFLALDRPTYDLKSVKNPTERAKKAAQALENQLIELMQRASKGEI